MLTGQEVSATPRGTDAFQRCAGRHSVNHVLYALLGRLTSRRTKKTQTQTQTQANSGTCSLP